MTERERFEECGWNDYDSREKGIAWFAWQARAAVKPDYGAAVARVMDVRVDVGDAVSGQILTGLLTARSARAIVDAALRECEGEPNHQTPIQDNIEANDGKYVGPEKMRVPKWTKTD